MPIAPPQSVLEAFSASVSHLVQRVEIYEFDGTTPWKPHIWPDLLENGTVNVSYDSEGERRNADLSLYNGDGEIDKRPDNFYYDKVLKVFYGIHVDEAPRQPTICIVEEFGLPGQAVKLKNMLTAAGFTRVRVNTTATTFAQVATFDVLISVAVDYAHNVALLTDAYNAGKSVLTFNLTATAAQMPLIVGTAGASTVTAARTHWIQPSGPAHPAQSGWSSFMTPDQYLIESLSFTPDGTMPAGWVWNPASTAVMDSVVFFNRPASARIDPSGSTLTQFQRTLPVTPGEKLTFAVHARADAAYNGTGSNSKLRVGTTTGTHLVSAPYDATRLTGGDWTRVSVDYTVPAGTTALQIRLDTDHTAGTLWLDEVEVTRETAPPVFRRITAAAAGATAIGLWQDLNNGTSSAIIAREQGGGSKWLHIQHTEFDPAALGGAATQVRGMLSAALDWLDDFEPIDYWETQIGEFVFEDIDTDSTNPDLMRVTCKDYAARCMQSKLQTGTTYTAGTSFEGFIKAQASNAGCHKQMVPPTTVTLPKDITYEADTERWKIMRETATALGFELFFNSQGYLVVRPFQDPLLTPAALILESGADGNLVSQATKASGARIKNWIVARGESSDSTVLPVWAEAKNEQPQHPARIAKLGPRFDSFTSPLLTTTAQCKKMAEDLLRVAGLEEFSMDFSAILFPWLEVGEIVEVRPDENSGSLQEPERYLLSTVTFPLDLSPMSGTGKRVTIIV